MIFDLKRPCRDCPFLKSMHFGLGRERAEGIVHAITDQGWFPCHKTTQSDDEGMRAITNKSQACAGALIIAEKTDRKGSGMQIGFRLGIYDPTRLDLDAPVFDNFEQWIERQAHDL